MQDKYSTELMQKLKTKIKKNRKKKPSPKKNPIRLEKENSNQREKKIYMERYHKDKGKGVPKTRKSPKLAKIQPVAERRLSKKRKKTREAIKRKIGTQIDQGKFSLVRNSTKNLYARRKCGGKILQRHTPQISHKQSYWRGNQGCWSVTVQKD